MQQISIRHTIGIQPGVRIDKNARWNRCAGKTDRRGGGAGSGKGDRHVNEFQGMTKVHAPGQFHASMHLRAAPLEFVHGHCSSVAGETRLSDCHRAPVSTSTPNRAWESDSAIAGEPVLTVNAVIVAIKKAGNVMSCPEALSDTP
jgi:hypothetical protein